MEVVAGVASVVGILGFTGQAVTGLLKLRRLLNNAAAAKETVTHVLETIDLLRSTLKEVERIVVIIEALPQHEINGRAILETGALKYQTKACARDVTEWILVAKKLDPRSRKGIKAFLRKIKVAAGKEDLQSLGGAISGHQQRIGIGISLLGSSLDVLGIHRLNNIDKGLGGLTEAHLKLNDLINSNQQGKLTEESLVALLVSQLDLDKIASSNASEASLQSIHESISSLASSVSQLVAKLSPSQQDKNILDHSVSPVLQKLVKIQWGCDAISGIEEAFEGDMCIYCCKYFAEQGEGTDWRARGQHLAREHYFGACNLGTTFSSWMSMKQHLSDFHDLSAQADKRDIASWFSCPQRSLPFFERNVEDKAQVMKLFEERPAASHILPAEFAAAIEIPETMNPGLQLLKNCFRGGTSKIDEAVKKRIHSLVDSGMIDSIVLLLWQIQQKLAYLVEELVIDEKNEMPDMILNLPSNSLPFKDPNLLGSMLLILTTELEAKNWREKIEPLFASNSNTAQSLALNDRINPWLLTVLRHSNNTRIIVAKEFGPEINNPSDIFPWISSAIKLWFCDGTAVSGGGLHLVSDGAIDSRDNLLESPVVGQDAAREDTDRCSPEVGGSGNHQSTNFMLGGSSNDSAASLRSELAAKRSPWGKQPMFGFGGSSSGESVSSFRHAPVPLEKKRIFSFEEELATRTIYENELMAEDTFETDEEDEIEEGAIDDDDDLSDWEDSPGDSGKSSIDDKIFFQRVDSRLNLVSRRSMLTALLHEKDSASAVANDASKSAPAMLQRSRTTTPNGPSKPASVDSNDEAPLMIKGLLRPSQEVRTAPQPIIMTTTNNPQQAALSPTTAQRNMLQTKLTASLRRTLLWERKQRNQTSTAVLNRRHSTGGL